MYSFRNLAACCALMLALVQPAPGAPPQETVTSIFARATLLLASNDCAAARRELAIAISPENASAAHRSLAQLLVARSFAMENNFREAMAEYGKIATIEEAPDHHLAESVREVARLRKQSVHSAGPRELPVVRPSLKFHVAPQGNDQDSGSASAPFASLERARDAIRALKKNGPLPSGGVAVVIQGGHYRVARPFQLASADTGSPAAPIVYRASDERAPIFSGGVKLSGFGAVNDRAVLQRLPAEARGNVVQLNLRQLGIANLWPLQLGGFASGRGFKTHPVMELFFNDAPLQLARWPNEGFINIRNVATNDGHRIHGYAGTKTGLFEFDSDRPLLWKNENDVRLYGYWFWDWADSYEQVASIDAEKRTIQLAPPYHTYGYRKGQRFYALNLLCEIDTPGEWYLDRASGILYLWPPGKLQGAKVELSAAPFPFVEVQDASHIRFEGITWEMGSSDAVSVSGGENVVFAGCTVRRFGGNGISLSGGKQNGALSCDVYSLGRGGIQVSGGDRKTLTAASNFVENCHIYDLSRVDHTYTPAVRVGGVGQRIANNFMHHIRSSAINLSGNDHLVEFNEAGHVVQESDDQGAVDMYGNPTFRGVVYRWNYFHHIGPWKSARTDPALGQAGIRLDDAICGVLIYGNIFRHAATGKHGFGGVQIHGGKDNIIDNNLFIDCVQGVSFSPWNEAHWLEFTRKPMQSSEINMALYTNRYPALMRINDDINVNHLWRNEFVNCDRMLRNNRAGRLLANREEAAPASWSAQLMAYPATNDITLSSAIPFSRMGLYTDPWRREVPTKLIRHLRTDE